MWHVSIWFGNINILLPPMTEEDAITVLRTLEKYPQQGVEYGLSEV